MDTRRRFAFAALAYAFAVTMLGTTVPTPMYALYGERMHFAVFTTTVVFAVYALGVLAALLVAGGWSDVLGRRPVLLAGLAFALASSAVFLFADNIALLLVGRLLSGLSAGLFTGTATAAVVESVPAERRDRAATVATMVNIGGLGSGPLLAGLLVQYAPHPLLLSFLVHIALLALAIPAVLLAPETSGGTGHIALQRLAVPAEVRAVFLTAATAAFAGFAVTGLFAAVAPAFLAEVIGVTNHAVGGTVAGSIFLSSAVAQLLGRRIPSTLAVAVGCAILVVGMVILAVALSHSSLPGIIAAAVIAGIGQGISFSRGLAAVVEQVPDRQRGAVSSTYFVVAYVAIALPVVGVGLAAQSWGLRTAGESFAAAIAVLALICLAAVLVQERRTRQLSGSTQA
ncbi:MULTISPECIES: MFS transporter [Mycobacteriaceae]|uniref:MFS transporter n=1 Tax=Mycolicibacterium neoaurum VKM Ac-1815D TaxID=700508 RepID=V5XGD2_MYCNE|nr:MULTISPECIES: MFS transporter [Mycobacteriaceae]AHC26893.1 MFS transporter [Mycolicibacterium neoaurum VKM Ac-1815D]AMO07182.1 MFS transporter [Mycolicibacterium neoaurum]AXK74440.1 MFS transporter [Mycolicibacterium neoaurum]KJQ50102.1 MFS transporter [Mycolicibacterium neoaurum]KUM07051.1 MFS transporter [Mycolicibacterium neoaurum]